MIEKVNKIIFSESNNERFSILVSAKHSSNKTIANRNYWERLVSQSLLLMVTRSQNRLSKLLYYEKASNV